MRSVLQTAEPGRLGTAEIPAAERVRMIPGHTVLLLPIREAVQVLSSDMSP